MRPDTIRWANAKPISLRPPNNSTEPGLFTFTLASRCSCLVSLLLTSRYAGSMVSTATALGDKDLVFLTEYHLATLTTQRINGTTHAVAVGFTFDTQHSVARIITSDGSQKVKNADRGGYATVTQIDGPRWLTLEGCVSVNRNPDAVAVAVAEYTKRYRPPRINPQRVVIEIAVTRILGIKK